MIPKIALVALLTLGLVGGAGACCPPTPIFGWVTDACTEEPLSRVKVQTEDDQDWTDGLGYYIVNAIGNYDLKTLKAMRDGYDLYRTQIQLNCGVPILHNIELMPRGGCEPEPYCGNEVCEQTLAYSEDCSTCPEDCGECEPEPEVRRKTTHNHCDHCFFVHGLARYYDNLLYGYWYNYAKDCGIEYDSNTPPQNLRWECNNKLFEDE